MLVQLPEFVCTSDFARLLHVSKQGLLNLARDANLKPFRPGRRKLLWHRDTVIRAMRERGLAVDS